MAGIKRITLWAGILILMVVMFGAGWLVSQAGIGAAIDPASLSDLERSFRERMQDTALVGRFTVDGRDTPGGSPDRYDISGVEKVGDDRWRFDVRMRHGNVDVTLPVAVPMVWVGDTPMVVMTDTNIPGIGAFTARVFFHGDRYAGTWESSAVKVGGLMYGYIEQGADTSGAPNAPPEGESPGEDPALQP